MLNPHARLKSSAALFALNHRDVPNNCASAIVATGLARQIGTGSELSIGAFAVPINFQAAPFSIPLIRRFRETSNNTPNRAKANERYFSG